MILEVTQGSLDFRLLKNVVHTNFVRLADLGSDDQQVPVVSDGLFWNPY